ncbi:MAG: cell division protein FtsK [Planctomycetes bacterium]|nr:cell division protein FtsK [Planctomycetota bacterium]
MSPREFHLNLEHYQGLLAELQAATDERQRLEDELRSLGGVEDETGLATTPLAIRQAATQFEQESAALAERHAEICRAIEDQWAQATATATAECQDTVVSAERQAAVDEARVDKKYQEDCWMVSSILDDKSENSPQRQMEKLASAIHQGQERLNSEATELEELEQRAFKLAEQRRFVWEDPPEHAPAVAGRDAALQAASEAAQTVRDATAHLTRDVLTALLNRSVFVVVGLLLWGMLSGIVYAIVDPPWVGLPARPGIEWPLIVGGTGFGVACLILMILHLMASNRSAEAFEAFQKALVDARFHAQHWQKLARQEMHVCEQEFQSRQAAVEERRQRSLQQFAEVRDQKRAEIELKKTRAVREAENVRDRALQIASEKHNAELLSAEAAHRREVAALRTRYDKNHAVLVRVHQQDVLERNARRRDFAERMTNLWRDALIWFSDATAKFQEESQQLFPPWEVLTQPDWQVPQEIPPGIRIGDYVVSPPVAESEYAPPVAVPDGVAGPQRLPAVLPFPQTPGLLLKCSGQAGRGQAVSILQSAMLRMLTQIPPGDLRFTIVDAVGLGENFAAFMHLADYDELLISGRIWTESSHIEQQLANLTEHMENVFQKYLRNEFESIEEYNRHAGEVAEPYRVLVIANFPAGFSERAAQRLVSIVSSGPRCGVHTLLSFDTRQPAPRGFDPTQLETGTNVLEWDGKQFMSQALPGMALPLKPDEPPPPALWAELIRKMGELSRHIRKVEVPFHRIAPREEAFWTGDSRSQIEVPLGRAGATKLQHLRLGKGTSQHVLVAGKTGSGKSTLLHVIVINLALRYSPDEVEFYLIDFKKGVEFKTYAAHHLPHARVISIESDREFGVSTLERLDAILKERGDLFRQAGVQDIAAFRDARPDIKMPRILLMVDEFQEFFVEDDKYSQTASLLLDRLVRQGRAFGMHVLLGSQTLGGAYSLARTTIGQMAVRIALQCSETDAHLILSENNTAARLLTRPGEAIYNDANGMVEGNNPFQVAWLDDAQRDGFLQRVESLATARRRPRSEAIVFEGNIPADPSRNAALCELVEAVAASAEAGVASPILAPRAWLGDAVAITGPTQVSFARRSGANLLVVGPEDVVSRGILQTVVIALATQSPIWSASSPASGEGETPAPADGPASLYLLAELAGSSGAAGTAAGPWGALLGVLPPTIRVAGPDTANVALTEISGELARRRQDRTPAPSIVLVVDDLSRFRDLRKSDDDFGFGSSSRDKGPTPGQMFTEILKEGPAVGIHVIVWCDSYNNIDRWFSRQTMREFEMRVLLQMSAADSSHLIDSPAAARLGANRALLYSDERGTLEKFRPYGLPSADWMTWLQQTLPHVDTAEPAVADDIDQWIVT